MLQCKNLFLCSLICHVGLGELTLVLLSLSASVGMLFSFTKQCSVLPFEKNWGEGVKFNVYPHSERISSPSIWTFPCFSGENGFIDEPQVCISKSSGGRQKVFYVSSWRKTKPDFTERLQQTKITHLISFYMVYLAASLSSTALRASTSLVLYHTAFHLQHLSWTLDTISVLLF